MIYSENRGFGLEPDHLLRFVGNERAEAPDPFWSTTGNLDAFDGTSEVAGLGEIRCSNSAMSVVHTLDGSEPDKSSPLYRQPFPLPAGGTVKALAYLDGEESFQTAIVSATFGVDRGAWKVVSVSLDSPYDNQGSAGVAKLLDDNPTTYWHTYHKDKALSSPPHEVVLDMGRKLRVSSFTFVPHGDGSDGVEGTPTTTNTT